MLFRKFGLFLWLICSIFGLINAGNPNDRPQPVPSSSHKNDSSPSSPTDEPLRALLDDDDDIVSSCAAGSPASTVIFRSPSSTSSQIFPPSPLSTQSAPLPARVSLFRHEVDRLRKVEGRVRKLEQELRAQHYTRTSLEQRKAAYRQRYLEVREEEALRTRHRRHLVRSVASRYQRIPTFSYVHDRRLIFEVDLDDIPPSRLGGLLFRYEGLPAPDVGVSDAIDEKQSAPSTTPPPHPVAALHNPDQPSTSASALSLDEGLRPDLHPDSIPSPGVNEQSADDNLVCEPLVLSSDSSGSPSQAHPDPGVSSVDSSIVLRDGDQISLVNPLEQISGQRHRSSILDAGIDFAADTSYHFESD